MQEDIIKLKEDIESFLKDSIEHQDKQIEYIIRNPKNGDTYVLASDGYDEAIEFTPQGKNYKEGFSYVPEWDYNFDYYIYNYLEEGYKIEYMSPNTHYGIRNSIHELYPDDIEFKDGVQSYLQYCVDNKITKQFIDKETGLDSPEVLQLFNGLAKGTYMEYKGYIALSTELNYDNQNEVLVNIYNSMQDFIDGESLETISLNEINLKDNIKEYIDDNYARDIDPNERNYLTFVVGYDYLNDMYKNSKTPECDTNYEFSQLMIDKFIESNEFNDMNYSSYEALGKWIENNKNMIKEEYSKFTGVDNELKIKFIGTDNWSRPVFKDENGKIYKDINLGQGTLALHTSNDFYGEPNMPIDENVKVNIVKSFKNKSDRER